MKKIKSRLYYFLLFFYLNFFSKIPFLKRICINIYALFNKFNIVEYSKEDLKKYLDIKKIDKEIIEDSKSRCVHIPKYYNDLDESNTYYFDSEQIYYYVLSNVSILGSTPFIIDNNKIISDFFANDRQYIANLPIIEDKDNSLVFFQKKDNFREVDEAINLCNFGSSNYYHFTIDNLSRLLYLKNKYQNVPILIDEIVSKVPQLHEILIEFSKQHPIIYVKNNEIIFVKKLIGISRNTWRPVGLKPNAETRLEDQLISESSLTNLSENVNQIEINKDYKFIFLSRQNTKNSRIKNEKEIENIFIKKGFVIINIENYSYKEQVSIFNNAKIIVGATGAAFANLTYCNKGAVIGIIIPKIFKSYLYSTIAYLRGCKTLFFSPKYTRNTFESNYDKWYVDPSECEKYIDELYTLLNDVK